MAANPNLALLNYCTQQMNLGALLLGMSNSKAAQGGNLAFIEVKKNGTLLHREHAFSNSSSLPNLAKDAFAPSVPQAHLGMVGIASGNQHGNHTEPKLIEGLKTNRHKLIGGFDEVIIASQLDCCPSCVKNTIKEMSGLMALIDMSSTTPIQFWVVEVNSGRVREGHQF